MKSFWRTKKDGSKTMVDSDPTNDWQDGYNAGRRWADKQRTWWIVLGGICGSAATLLAFIVGHTTQ